MRFREEGSKIVILLFLVSLLIKCSVIAVGINSSRKLSYEEHNSTLEVEGRSQV